MSKMHQVTITYVEINEDRILTLSVLAVHVSSYLYAMDRCFRYQPMPSTLLIIYWPPKNH